MVTVITFNLRHERPQLANRIDRLALRTIVAFFVVSYGLVLITSQPGTPGEPVAPTPETGQDTRPDTLKDTLVVQQDFLPHLHVNNILRGLLYRGLTHEVAGGRLVPHLVERIPALTNECVRFPVAGGAIVRWRLKRDLRWGDGAPITADDLLFTFRLWEDDNISKLMKIDYRTVDVVYREKKSSIVDAQLLYPRHQLEAVHQAGLRKGKGKDRWRSGWTAVWDRLKHDPPPLDGPYIVEKFEKGKMAVLRVNPYFVGRKPLIRRIVIKVFNQPAASVLGATNADLVCNVRMESFRKAGAFSHVQRKTIADDWLTALFPDIKTAPLNNPRFRRGLLLAINRKQLARRVHGEQGQVAHSYWPNFARDYNENIERYPHDPVRARALLAPFARHTVVIHAYHTVVANKSGVGSVQGIKRDLEAVGLQVELKSVKGSTLGLARKGGHGGLVYTSRRSIYSMPQRFFNKGKFATTHRSILERFRSSMYRERRDQLSHRLQAQWARSLPILPLYFGVDRSIYNRKLRGWRPTAGNIWWNVEDWYFKKEAGSNSRPRS